MLQPCSFLQLVTDDITKEVKILKTFVISIGKSANMTSSLVVDYSPIAHDISRFALERNITLNFLFPVNNRTQQDRTQHEIASDTCISKRD